MIKRFIKILGFVSFIISLLFLLSLACRAFVCDRFVIKGESMSPTYSSGEAVWVNKLLMGARIYTDFDFSSPRLEAFRMPGLRKPRVGEVVLCNYPHGRENFKIEFRINYVYAKRILGCPGDTVGIRNGFCYNTSYDGPFGVPAMQEALSHTPDSLLGYSPRAYPHDETVGWTVYDMGPLLVPSSGMTVPMDRKNTLLYGLVIEYETGVKPQWIDGNRFHDGNVLQAYTFVHDYYYLIGDNVLNSKDSRYFGFVPELYIIGIIG